MNVRPATAGRRTRGRVTFLLPLNTEHCIYMREREREGLGPCPDTALLTISALCVFLIRNGLTTDKPAVTEDVNIYQKYIAR